MDHHLFEKLLGGARCHHSLVLRGAGVLGAGLLVMGLEAREAVACSYELPPAALVGSPASGDMDVPTDVVPYYSTSAARPSGDIGDLVSLVSANGDVVQLSVKSDYGDAFELVPEQALEPNTEYTLSAELKAVRDGTVETVVEQLTFTTGDGPFEGTLEPPDASLVHYHFATPRLSSCSPSEQGTCVAFEPQQAFVASAIDEFGQEHSPEIRDRPYFINLSGIDQGTNFTCERLRTRAPNGTLSDPVDLCGGDAPLYTLGDDEDIECTSEGLTQGGVLVTEDTNTEPLDGAAGADAGPQEPPPDTVPEGDGDSGDETAAESGNDGAADSGGSGCSLTGSAPGSRSVGWLAVGLLPLAWAARVTRRRRR